MTDPILYMRAIERLIAVSLGGLCVFLGYKLFNKAVDQGGELEVAHQNSKLLLKQVAPGVFFALFGCGVILSSIVKNYSSTANDQSNQNISYNNNPTQIVNFPFNESKNALYAINAIINSSPDEIPKLTNFTKYKSDLEAYRVIMIDSIAGAGSFVKYKLLEKRFLSDPSSLTATERSDYESINDLATAK